MLPKPRDHPNMAFQCIAVEEFLCTCCMKYFFLPFLPGFVYAYIQDYSAVYMFGALAFLGSGVVLLLEPILASAQTWRERRRQDHSAEASVAMTMTELAAWIIPQDVGCGAEELWHLGTGIIRIGSTCYRITARHHFMFSITLNLRQLTLPNWPYLVRPLSA